MREGTPRTVFLKDYQPPAFLIDTVDLDIALLEDQAIVRAVLTVRRNRACAGGPAPLVLDGEDLQFESAALDGRPLSAQEYQVTAQRFILPGAPDQFTMETTVRINPRTNTTLSGLYCSKDGYFTQCEAEGFRRITYFVDRPDVMARYTTTIHADRRRYPLLLSNGNLVDSGEEGAGRHWARWVDPHPKPSYLFAMVAANLEVLEDTYRTASGRSVRLAIYVEPGKLDQCSWAMQALKKAMKWDEEVFGLEVDLDQYMIVAVGDFNMGAMENKGLNIFNTRYVLARPDVATDLDYHKIDRVVGHEYFHNWTGNRVTCRDWFQLSLKEGLTVFRDQEFGADLYSRGVARIQQVRGLRAVQFPEDAGTMAHPVRPASYMEINNFYTPTVYEKGAELVRMIHTLIGAARFRDGMGLYFRRHDGQAVTCEEFVGAMQDASGVDLRQFMRWYDQAGTPTLRVTDEYDPAARRYALRVRQSCPPTAGQTDKLPLHIPFTIALLGGNGAPLPLQLADETPAADRERVLSVTQAEQAFVFENVPERPVPSLLRRFSAPVKLEYEYTDGQLTALMSHDSDPFSRWEAGQRLATGMLLRGAESVRDGGEVVVPDRVINAFRRVLADGEADPAFAAEAISLPAESVLAEQMQAVDPDALHTARNQVREALARSLRAEWLATYEACRLTGAYSPDAASAGRRALRNTCLGYLAELHDPSIYALCLKQFNEADNMTDTMAALSILANHDCTERVHALGAFHERWKEEALIVDKWLSVQATSRLPDTIDRVRQLLSHPAFDLRNPNKVYSLIRGFTGANHVRFHARDGRGYAFAADQIIALDQINPQVAARIARCFDRWKRFDDARQAAVRAQLERIRAVPGLSRDVEEVVTRALA
ncbi:MAG: aminopeptidase N [Gammaproteobacteria bacterium]|nr:aminopeptidase N [Gammaproteobacteria bacterium]